MDDTHFSTRVTLTRELSRLKGRVLSIGNDCCQLLALVISSLSVPDLGLESRAASVRGQIHHEAEALDKQCLSILSLQQPLLKDLRLVVGTMRMAVGLTRISSYCDRLLQMNSLLDDSSAIPEELREIAENCHSMLQDALIAFDTGSVELANQLVERDRQIDLLHDSSSQKIIRKLARESTAYFETETHMLTSLRLLERTGDAIVSIAQEVNFIHSGQR